MDLETGDRENSKSSGSLGSMGRKWIDFGGQSCLECDLEGHLFPIDRRYGDYLVLPKFDLEGYLEWVLRYAEGSFCCFAQTHLVVGYVLWGRKL